MKIRNGFVSNSSTTSFCIYGAWVDAPKVEKPVTNIDEDDDDIYDDDDDNDDEIIEKICEESGLGYHTMSYSSRGYAVGLSPWDMDDNETAGQFKKRISDSLKKYFGEDVECEWIEEASYDG